MRFAVVAHRPSSTNIELLVRGLPGAHPLFVSPAESIVALRPGDVALGRIDVREELDGVEDGLHALDRLEAAGVRVLNRSSALVAAHDKLLTARVLESAGVPHPRTQLLRTPADRPSLDFPLVLKPRFGSWGRDVTLCRDEADLERCLRRFAFRRWFRAGAIAQALVPPPGHDLRLIVAGGLVVGAAARVAAPGEWRTNVALGGTRLPALPSPAARMLALRAAAAVGGDLVGIDLLPVDDDDYVVLEVNGAVDFTVDYSLGGDVFDAATAALAAAANAVSVQAVAS